MKNEQERLQNTQINTHTIKYRREERFGQYTDIHACTLRNSRLTSKQRLNEFINKLRPDLWSDFGLAVPVCSSALQAEAEVVHPVQVLSREGVVPQLPEVLGPQILPSVPRHGVITLGEWTEDQR